MNGLNFWKIYLPIHLHFTTDFDCLKYKGKLPGINKENYEKRKEKNLVEFFGNKFNSDLKAGNFCLANSVISDNWLYNDFNEAESVYEKWAEAKLYRDQMFEADVVFLKDIIKSGKVDKFSGFLKNTASGNKPPLLQLLIHKKISMESIAILDNFLDFTTNWEKKYEQDPMLNKLLFNLKKYKPFVSFNKQIASKLIREHFSE